MSKDLTKILLSYKNEDLSLDETIQTINNLFQESNEPPTFPEMIKCEGIPSHQIQTKITELMEENKSFIAIKASEEVFNYVRLNVPDIFFYDEGHAIFSKPPRINNLLNHKISILSNNYVDPVAVEEAYIVSRMCGIEAYKQMDMGKFGSNFTENDHKILQHTQFIIYITAGYHPNIDWLTSSFNIPVILVPVIKKEMMFIEQMHTMSSVLFSENPKVLRTSFNAAGEAAFIASQLLLRLERNLNNE